MARALLFTAALVSLFATEALAREESLLARVTVYWPAEGGPHACFNGVRLRPGHCAVDPKKIPYGSKVYFPDGPCLAVDTGPAVINRKAARLSGRNSRERNALVIDRFFESKEKALAWERAHPHFMTVQVISGRSSRQPRAEPIEQRATITTRVAQTMAPPTVVQASAPPAVVQTGAPSPLPRPKIVLAATAVLTIPERSRISVPPSYHRRRFAAHAENEPEVPPPICTIRPIKRSRAV
jgi:3D (Asp-Asp-Asp) domain-containing protein